MEIRKAQRKAAKIILALDGVSGSGKTIKMSNIDSLPDRSVGCQQFVNGLYEAIGLNKYHWFVS